MSQIVAFPNFPWTEKKFLKPALNDYKVPQMQILKYMGNKRRLLDWLMKFLNEELKNGDTFLDLFAGTSSVGYALKPKVRVLANDIQEYSSVISSALLEFNGGITEDDFDKELAKFYKKNFSRLMDIFGEAVQEEEKLLNSGSIKDYNQFCLEVPKYGEPVPHDKFKLNFYSLESFIQNRRTLKTKFPYILFITYYPNTFFGLKQCAEIDSIRFAIDQIKDAHKKAVYLSCLMYAMSKAVNSSGHFAEYLNHHSDYASKLILEQRKISVLAAFLFKLSEFTNLFIQNKWKNEVYNYDYQALIEELYKNKKIEEIDLIYIDPPYTNAQYSRYYHIPETLVKYDYPNITKDRSNHHLVKGRYRNDRHQSRFSNTGTVELAFRELFGAISSKTRATLAVSYSDNSILRPVDRLIAIAKEYYETIETKNGYSHSAQGSKFTVNGKGNRDIHEYLLICKPKG